MSGVCIYSDFSSENMVFILRYMYYDTDSNINVIALVLLYLFYDIDIVVLVFWY